MSLAPSQDTPATTGVGPASAGLNGRSVAVVLPGWLWPALTLLLGIWVARQLGAFDLWTSVVREDGQTVRLVNTFASVDHPFHAVRAEELRRSLANGHLLRWIANHQGGYPAEFYPLGVAWLEVGVWALLLGSLPIVAVHKLVVIGIFLLPGLAFWLMARRDAWSGAVPLAALLVHVGVPGGWVNGGWKELVVWGLVTNVAASVSLLFVLWGLSVFLVDARRIAGVVASLCAAFAIGSNPRSLIALGVVGVGCWVAAVETSPARWRGATGRLALVGATAASLSAPVLIPLIRFSDLYHFVRYSGYSSIGFYVEKIVTSVSWPVAILGVAGVVVGLFAADRPTTRAAAVSLALYVLATAVLATDLRDAGALDQLEATRLMPFQRLVTIYLASVACEAGLRWLLPRFAAAREVLVVGGAAGVLLVYVVPFSPVPENNHGLMYAGEAARPGSPVLLTSGSPAQADFLRAVEIADGAAPGDGAMLILGTTISWHQQLWAPLETDRPLFYNDWLWYWQTEHQAPAGLRAGNAYARGFEQRIFQRAYLNEHGIAVVVVADPYKQAAASASTLEVVTQGLFNVYRVRDPAPIVTFDGGQTADVTVENERIEASGTSPGGEARIARNWFPRWRAEVNGKEVPITHTADGYMSVPVPAGEVTVTLRYDVDGLDWLGRALFILGLAAAILLVLARPFRIWSWSQSPPARDPEQTAS